MPQCGAAESIMKLVGEAQRQDELRALLHEVGNGDENRVRAAREALRSVPGISTELLATLQVAIRMDTLATGLETLQSEHVERGKRGCSTLQVSMVKLEKKFFRGVCLCLLLPILLWAFFSVAQFLWRKQRAPRVYERTVDHVGSRDHGTD